mgnify:CR=1 FL=1
MVDKKTEEVIRNLDEKKVLEMLEAEWTNHRPPDLQREQKKLLYEIGLYDVDLDNFDLSDEIKSKVRYLADYDMESDVQPNFSEEVEQRTRERLRELGLEPPEDN